MGVLISFCSKNCKKETLLLILLHIHLAKRNKDPAIQTR